MSTKTKANELRLVRVYDASLEDVWQAWADPEKAAKWWGPRGFTITHHSKELKPGGSWQYTMHGPDGAEWKNISQYLEVEPLKKLVYDHGATKDSPPLFRVTVLFSENNGKTEMDMTMALETAEAAARTAEFVKKAGGDATWDRLAEYLNEQAGGVENFVINRSFAAPRELVFDMFTKPEHLSKWMGPAGAKCEFLRADVSVGSGSFYSMSVGDGPKMFGRTEYRTIDRPNRMVYVQQFCDENENITRHPFAPAWPLNMLTTVEFTDESEGTRVTLTWQPEGENKAEEIAVFVGGRAGMTVGWTGSFDNLQTYLAEAVVRQ